MREHGKERFRFSRFRFPDKDRAKDRSERNIACYAALNSRVTDGIN